MRKIDVMGGARCLCRIWTPPRLSRLRQWKWQRFMASLKCTHTRQLTLAGYLELHRKGWRGSNKKKRKHWFWFDEQTCCLKYYRNQEAYQQKLFEPLGAIDLRYATITPAVAADNLAANQFQITVESQIHTLATEDTEESHRWIRNLQDKREQWIRRESALDMTDFDRQAKKRTLKPPHVQPVGLLQVVENKEEDDQPTVRKIMSRHMRHSSSERRSLPVEDILGSKDYQMKEGRVTRCHTYKDVSKDGEDLQLEDTSVLQSENPIHHKPENREILQLQHKFHKSQEEVTKLQKEIVRLKEKMEKRNEEIAKLLDEVDFLKESLVKSKALQNPNDIILEMESLKSIVEQYKRSVKSLVDEIDFHKLHETEHGRRIRAEKEKVDNCERHLNEFKAKYVVLLSDKFKVVVPNPSSAVEEEEDPENEQYNEELLQLLKRESEGNDLFQSYKSTFRDQYGDQHDWQSGTTVQHYLCRQLFIHYTSLEQEKLLQEWTHFLEPVKKVKGKSYMDLLPSNDRAKRRELRNLLRRGVPNQYRTQIWTRLLNVQLFIHFLYSLVYRLEGRTKDVKDSVAGPKTTYYQSLLDSKKETLSEKQIKLDLYRTLPSNMHFRSDGQGASKLHNVLIAYSHHNISVGYCQGMNLIAAIALLFVDEETAFWFLAVIIEKLLPVDYFSPGLLGAQADQAMLREVLPQKLPRLSAHLDLHAIDVTLVTFNWFLTLFIDAMPTESVLRIIDCFLLEGSKVLYRVALGILKVNARRMLSITDPVALFQMLKEIAKHSFDIDHLLKVAFTGLEPFPPRSTLTSRHHYHFGKMKEQWVKREKEAKEREARNKLEKLKKQPQQLGNFAGYHQRQKARRHLLWECGCVRRSKGVEQAWLCCGDRQQGRIAIVTATDGHFSMEVPSNDVGSRVICIGYVSTDIVILGTLDFNLHAFDCFSKKRMWSKKTNDSVLAIRSTGDATVFAALADGFVAVLQNVSAEPPENAPHLIRIGSDPVPCLALANTQQLWCGCGKTITILSSQTFEPLHGIAIEDPLGKMYKMEASQYGIWVSFRSSSVVSLFDARLYVNLMQVDYTSLLTSECALLQQVENRVTSIMASRGYLWLGTGSGKVLIFSICRATAKPEEEIQKMAEATSKALGTVQDEEEDEGEEEEARSKGLWSGSGGLLKEGLSAPEGWGKEPDSQAASEPPSTPGPVNWKKRKTVFGHTLRGSSMNRGNRRPAVFQLVYKTTHQLADVKNESVRVLLPLSGSSHSLAVSCVHSVSDWGKGVQAWHCEETPENWSFEYLPLSTEDILDCSESEHWEAPQKLCSSSDRHTAPTNHQAESRGSNKMTDNNTQAPPTTTM